MAGYWPSSFFLRVYEVSVPKHARKQPISSHLDRKNLVNKGFIIWDKTPKMIFDLAGPSEKSRAGRKSYILPARVANHSAGFGSSCPLTELVINNLSRCRQAKHDSCWSK